MAWSVTQQAPRKRCSWETENNQSSRGIVQEWKTRKQKMPQMEIIPILKQKRIGDKSQVSNEHHASSNKPRHRRDHMNKKQVTETRQINSNK
jgi:hypothetical protein